jgi:hypothetical protein
VLAEVRKHSGEFTKSCDFKCVITWHLAPGTWHLAPGTWHLAPGTWHLAPGTWHLAPGSVRCSALNPKFAKLKTMGRGTPPIFRYRSLLDLANLAPLR